MLSLRTLTKCQHIINRSTTIAYQYKLEKSEGTINNRQSRDTSNAGQKTQNKNNTEIQISKKMSNTDPNNKQGLTHVLAKDKMSNTDPYNKQGLTHVLAKDKMSNTDPNNNQGLTHVLAEDKMSNTDPNNKQGLTHVLAKDKMSNTDPNKNAVPPSLISR